MSWVQVIPVVTLSDITPLNNLLLYANFDKSTVGLHYIHILSMFAKFHNDKKSIIMHICTVTIAFAFNILLLFFLSFYSLPHSRSGNLCSRVGFVLCQLMSI